MPTPSRSPLLATALLCSTALAQGGYQDLLWLGSDGKAVAIDRFGVERGARNAPITGPAHRAPNGSLWFTNTTGNGLVIVPLVGQPQNLSLPAALVDLVFDSYGNAWAALDNSRLLQFSPTGGRTHTLATNTITAMASASGGVIWLAEDDGQGGLLRRVTATGNTTTVVAPAHQTIVGLAAAYRGTNPSHVWAITATTRELVEFDSNGVELGSVTIGGSGESLRQVIADVRGGVWILGSTAIYRYDSRQALTSTVRKGVFDEIALGTKEDLWLRRGHAVIRLDASGNVDVHSVVNGDNLALGDAMGYAMLLGSNPLGDLDADGGSNADELLAGSNPADSQSNPAIALDFDRVNYSLGNQANLQAQGRPGSLVLLFGSASGGQMRIGGISGSLRLDPATVFPSVLPANSPSMTTFTIPRTPSLNGLNLWTQALYVGGTYMQFSEHTLLQIREPTVQAVAESFQTTAHLDLQRSAGQWGNGQLVAGRLGGDGRLGSFDPTDGNSLGNGVYEWNTDNSVIPGGHTRSGQPITVTNGEYEFSDLTIPAGTVVRFVGSKPAVIQVTGQIQIDGRLELNGEIVAGTHDGNKSLTGQKGGRPGAGGGSGGDGAFRCDGTGNPTQTQFNNFNGFDGENVQVPAGHSFAGNAVGTSGRGAQLFPAHGDKALLRYKVISGQYESSAGAGGSGGGFDLPGTAGVVINAGAGFASPLNTNPADMGPLSPGGQSFTFLPKPAAITSIDHYLVGGSGGGGGASHPLFSRPVLAYSFWSSGAGAGGGGAVALQAGRSLRAGALGQIEAIGGSCQPPASALTILTLGVPAPGGGGSGGSVLIQVDGAVQLGGMIDVSGGTGGQLKLTGFFTSHIRAGNGSPGFFRVETPTLLPLAQLGSTQPAAQPRNVGVLSDVATRTATQSTWYSSGSGVPVEFLHYTIKATVNGQAVTWTDDPQNFNPANVAGQPIQFLVQGGEVDPATNMLLGSAGPWRDFVSSANGRQGIDNATGFRWLLVFDRTTANQMVVTEVTVRFRWL